MSIALFTSCLPVYWCVCDDSQFFLVCVHSLITRLQQKKMSVMYQSVHVAITFQLGMSSYLKWVLSQHPTRNNFKYSHKVHFSKGFFRENIDDFVDLHRKKFKLEVTCKRNRFGYWNSCKRLPNFVNVAALVSGHIDKKGFIILQTWWYCWRHHRGNSWRNRIILVPWGWYKSWGTRHLKNQVNVYISHKPRVVKLETIYFFNNYGLCNSRIGQLTRFWYVMAYASGEGPKEPGHMPCLASSL